MISRKDVEHIARLARIRLTEAEKEKFGRELSSILDFVAQLNGVDTAAVEPLAGGLTRLTTGGTALENVMREDNGKGESAHGKARELLEAAPRQRNGYVEVEAVFERE